MDTDYSLPPPVIELRDYFAGLIIQALVTKLTGTERRHYADGDSQGREAAVAYAIADAMLAQRAK